jgi:hypothetical protein
MKRDYEKSSGNVFADLGFRNSKQEPLKAKLTVENYKLLKAQGGYAAGGCKTARYHAGASVRTHALQASVGIDWSVDGVFDGAWTGRTASGLKPLSFSRTRCSA